MVVWLAVLPVFGQVPQPEETQPELPEESGPVRAQPAPPAKAVPGEPAKPVPEVPAEAPTEAPSVEHRPTPAARIRELSKRLLNIQTTDNGTNATTFLRRIQFSNEYRDRRDSSRQDETVLRLDYPVLGAGVVRMDLPFLWFDPNTTGGSTSTGLGDIFIRAGLRLIDRPGFQFFAGGDVIFPTASKDDLGRGKYQIGPGAAVSIPVPEFNSIFFPLVQHFQSVGGDPARADVNHTRFRVSMDTPWTAEWWTTVEPTVTLDWTKNGKTGMNLEFEVGRKLGPNYRAWTRGGAGLWGDGVVGAYDWLVQVGVRYLF